MNLYFVLAVLSISISTITPLAYAQTPTTTTTIPVPTVPSNLRFQEQPAYIQIQPPAGAQQQSSNGGINEILISMIGSVGAAIGLKLHSDKKTADVKTDMKETKAEVLVGKEVSKEIAKVAYAANPEAAAKIEGVPIIKNETLAKDASQYAQKVTKDANNDD